MTTARAGNQPSDRDDRNHDRPVEGGRADGTPEGATLDLEAQIGLLRSRRQLDARWYLSEYRDVAETGLSAAEHYLRIGAALCRNPRKRFDTGFYLDTYPEVAARGVNPLVHYALEGEAQGLRTRPSRLPDPRQTFEAIRHRYLALGVRDTPFDDLAALIERTGDPALRAQMMLELGLWLMRPGSRQDHAAALARIAAAQLQARDAPQALRLRGVMAALTSLALTGRDDEGRCAYEAAALDGLATPDVLLARANFEPTPERRLVWINEALAAHGIAALRLGPEGGPLAYDRLVLDDPAACPSVTEGPKVTVLVATYDAAGQIRTALDSLRGQSWRNLEVIVLDDGGPEDGTAGIVQDLAVCDARFRYVRMAVNGGAYVARNHGLDLASGDYVTLHDADDWSHPRKIETQVRFMQAHPGVVGCTSEQARMTEDLRFTQLRSSGTLIIFNTSSLLFRRDPVRAALGYWDTVRFEADTEFIARLQWAFGKPAFHKIPTGPLSFQRQSEGSATAGRYSGVDVMRFGARREYFNASRSHHAGGGSLLYTGRSEDRPFAAPRMMRSGRTREVPFFDHVIVGDFREETEEVAAMLDLVRRTKAEGRRVALAEFFDIRPRVDVIDDHRPAAQDICAAARAEIDGRLCEMLVYGDVAHYGALHLIGPAAHLAVERAAGQPGPDGPRPALGAGWGGQDFLPTLLPRPPGATSLSCAARLPPG